jgi:hypothetical protein
LTIDISIFKEWSQIYQKLKLTIDISIFKN